MQRDPVLPALDTRDTAKLWPLQTLIHRYLLDLDAAPDFAEAWGAALACTTGPACQLGRQDPLHDTMKADWTHGASEATFSLVTEFLMQMQALRWGAPYGDDPAAGTGFADNAMACILLGPLELGEGRAIMGGFFAVGPGCRYADHRHGAPELYVPLSGRARFWAEQTGWRVAGPDDVIVHPAWEAHALETGANPVLILWIWLAPMSKLMTMPELLPCFGGMSWRDSSR